MCIVKEIAKCEKKITELVLDLTVAKKVLECLYLANLRLQDSKPSKCTAEHIQEILADHPLSCKQIGIALLNRGICRGSKTKPNRIASSCLQRRTDLFESAGRGLYRLIEIVKTVETVETAKKMEGRAYDKN